MILLMKYTKKDKGLRGRSSLSSRIMEQVPLGLVVAFFFVKVETLNVACQHALLAPAEVTELAFDLLGIS